MAAFIVAYDLHKQGQNYQGLVNQIQSYGTHWHMQGSVWIVVTHQSAIQLRDTLLPYVDRNDQLFVGELSGNAAWYGYNANVGNWLAMQLDKQAA